MPLEPGVTTHIDAMASHFGQKHWKTKQPERKTQTNNTASEHPSSTRPGPCFFFWSRGTLFSGGGSLSFATQDCTLLKMSWGHFSVVVVRDSRLHLTENAVSPRVFFLGGGDVRAVERQLRQGQGTAEP